MFFCSCFPFFPLSFSPFYPLCTFISSVLMSLILLRTQHKHACAPAGFEPAIPAGDWPQTLALDRSATGIGIRSPDHPGLIEALYRLSYPGPFSVVRYKDYIQQCVRHDLLRVSVLKVNRTDNVRVT